MCLSGVRVLGEVVNSGAGRVLGVPPLFSEGQMMTKKKWLLFWKILVLVLALGLCGAAPAAARPVSYAGGWTVMQFNDASQYALLTHYSPTARYALGYLAVWWREAEYQAHALQVNHLLKRWNQPDAQANIYLKSGLGVAVDNRDRYQRSTEPYAFSGLAIDWENRRWFTMYENSYRSAGDFDEHFNQSATLGLAPYVGEYGDLHTWLMVKTEHQPGQDDKVMVTPFVRFFKGTWLWEVGVSDEGDVLFNWIKRF